MSASINTEAQKDPDQLEREVDERRAHMGDTLNALEEKLSPGHFFDQVLNYTRRNGGEFSQNLVDTIKNNPVPTLLTAVGVTWLMYGHNNSSSSGTTPSMNTYSTSNTGIGSSSMATNKTSMMERGVNLKESLTNSATEAKHKVSDTAGNLRHQAQRASASLRDQGQRAKLSFTQLLEEQPLAVGAIGIAIGALLGGALPSTQTEDKIMGEARDQAADKTTKALKDSYEKAGDIGKKIMQDAKQEARTATQPSSYRPQ